MSTTALALWPSRDLLRAEFAGPARDEVGRHGHRARPAAAALHPVQRQPGGAAPHRLDIVGHDADIQHVGEIEVIETEGVRTKDAERSGPYFQRKCTKRRPKFLESFSTRW